MKDLSNENIIHIVEGNIQYIQFRKLLEYQEIIRHAFTLRELDFGLRDKIEIDRIYRNNDILCKSIGLDYKNIVKPYQTHTNEVKIIDKKINADKPDMYLPEYKDTDGVITNKEDLILATCNADCMLLLFFDPVKKVIANVHSGWKGAFAKIAEVTVEKMKKVYGSNPKDIICCISPSIKKCHFEVEDDVKSQCEEAFCDNPYLAEIITKGKILEGKQKYHIDLVLITKTVLEEAGLKAGNIIDSKICSVCESDYVHSFRATGNHNFKHGTAVIGLK